MIGILVLRTYCSMPEKLSEILLPHNPGGSDGVGTQNYSILKNQKIFSQYLLMGYIMQILEKTI